MLYTNQKYVDPKQVLASVVDDSGNLIKFGQEKDSTEFLLNLIERIEEGLDEEAPQSSQRIAQSMYEKGGNPESKKSESQNTESKFFDDDGSGDELLIDGVNNPSP